MFIISKLWNQFKKNKNPAIYKFSHVQGKAAYFYIIIVTPKCISFQRTDRYKVMKNYNTKKS